MNCSVIMNAQLGSATQAVTPVRSACTRRPVMAGQALFPNRNTSGRPSAAAAPAASDGSVTGPVVAGVSGSTWARSNLVSGATANAVAAATAAQTATTAAALAGSRSVTARAITKISSSGADQ